ncbi:MAG TPA: S1/P1 nuclease [Phnomibacter sp.]|nr:S1/P1 nuclease [Phnomibacter sp.]
MKKRFLVFFTLLFVSLAVHQQANAYGVTGHRVVAEIAQRNLSKKTLKGLQELIGKQALAFWSNWPDFIKSDTTHAFDEVSVWHYVDVSGHLQAAPFVDSLKALKGKNLYTQIPAMMATIQNKNLPLIQRQQALYLLIHFVGDLHQPLHVGRDEDAGGNKINVMWFDKKTNLHSVWDSELVNFQQYSYTEYASVLNIASKSEIATMQSGSLDDWFYESHVLSDKIYDATPDGSKLGYKYNFIFARELDNQLLKGGLRLAKLLNEVFE